MQSLQQAKLNFHIRYCCPQACKTNIKLDNNACVPNNVPFRATVPIRFPIHGEIEKKLSSVKLCNLLITHAFISFTLEETNQDSLANCTE